MGVFKMQVKLQYSLANYKKMYRVEIENIRCARRFGIAISLKAIGNAVAVPLAAMIIYHIFTMGKKEIRIEKKVYTTQYSSSNIKYTQSPATIMYTYLLYNVST